MTKLFLPLALSLIIGVTTACGNSSGSSSTAAAAATPLMLILTPSSTTIALGGTVSIAVSGGSGSYVNAAASEGSLALSSPAIYTFTAPSSTLASYFEITVTDSNGNKGYTAIGVNSAAPSGATKCGGTYAATIDTTLSATMVLVQDPSGKVAGHLKMVDYYYPVIGTCTGGQLSLKELINNNNFTSPISLSGIQNTLSGTLITAGGQIYGWSAVSQSLNEITTPVTSCAGNFNAVIGPNSGTMTLVQDGSGRVAGYLLLQGYYYVLSGTFNGTTVSLMNLTTGSAYSGNVAFSGAAVSISGTFTTSDGTQLMWSAQSN